MKASYKQASRERINTYVAHGGLWIHLEILLIENEMSDELTSYFVSRIRNSPRAECASKAAQAFGYWKQLNIEKDTKVVMKHSLPTSAPLPQYN